MFSFFQEFFQWSVIFLISFSALAAPGNSYYRKPKPTPTPIVTVAPTVTAAPTATLTPTPLPTATLTPTLTPLATPTPTVTPTLTATPTATLTPTIIPGVTSSPSATPTLTLTINISPTASPSPSLTPSPTATPSPTPTATPSATPTPSPTLTPTEVPTPTPAITKIGIDVSYPQCGRTLPTGHGFGIVGVNGGIATTTNPCLSTQLIWANQALGTVNQSPVQLYVNTGNPGLLSASWPTNNVDSAGNTAPNPYGVCDGTDSLSCAWQYGWNRAVDDVNSKFIPAAQAVGISTEPSTYPWWLDVETANSWKYGSDFSFQSNRAVLEAMTAYFKSRGITVGIYSTNYQWNLIVGPVPAESNLIGLPNWRAGASDLAQAQTYCSLTPLTPSGTVSLTQYVDVPNNLDYNYSCL